MTHKARIHTPGEELEAFCKRHSIRKLSFFGSVVREDFGPESDVDVLVEFEEEKVPGLFGLAGMEMELAEILKVKRVDLNTPDCLSRYFRDAVMTESEVQYVQA